MEDALWGDVFAAKAIVGRETFRQNEKGYVLEVYLPNTTKENLDLYQADSAVIVKAGNFKRNIPLPNVLCNYDVTGARYENERLCIQFEQGDDTVGAERRNDETTVGAERRNNET